MENNQYFESACKSLLKQQDTKRLFQILNVLRTGLNDKYLCNTRIKLLTEHGCVRSLTLCLQHESVAILDIALSLLGNACISSPFCIELLKYGILHILNRLLERCQKDSVQGRTFRIIGNLCDHTCTYAMMTKEPDLVHKIVAFIVKCCGEGGDQISEGSIIMAVRALRKLYKQSTAPLLIDKYNALNAIGLLMIKYSKLWIENKQHRIIVDDVLRLLHAYSRYSYSGMLSSIANTTAGNALYCLVDFFDFQPLRVIKIIRNLTSCITLKTDLPLKEIFDLLYNRLIKSSDMQTRMKYLYFLNTLLEEPPFRQYVNSVEYARLFVETLKGLKTRSNSAIQSSTLVLSLLKKCSNDSIALKNQIQAGAIGALIEKLGWCGKSPNEITPITHGKKRRAKSHFKDSIKKRREESMFINTMPGIDNSCWGDNQLIYNRSTSPSELSDISSDGPNSPSCSAIREDICDSDNYSPVCSDTEDIEVQSLRSLEPNGGYDSPSEEETPPISKSLTEFIAEIYSLLLTYSKVKETPKDIYDPKLITLLVNLSISMEDFFSTPFSRFLESILSQNEILIPLIQSNFVPNIYSKMNTTHDAGVCTMCDNLLTVKEFLIKHIRKSMESDFGKWDIRRNLIIPNLDLQLKIATSVSHVIRSKVYLVKLMKDYGGLKTIMSAITKTNVTQDVITSLHNLAVNFVPAVNLKQLKVIHSLEAGQYPTEVIEGKNLVLFKFEDCEDLVPVDRQFLSVKSDYFNSLLCGNFKESIETEVNMVGIKSVAFKTLLLLLCFDHSEVYVKLDLEIMLELLEMTDRYLLPDLHVYLLECVEFIYMKQEFMPTIYQWSINSGTNILRVECIVFALTFKMFDADRFAIFANLINLNYNEHLIDDISTLLLRFMVR